MDNNRFVKEVFNKNASLYQEKYMDVSLYSESFDIFCDNLPRPDANVLELACGPGNITRYLLDKLPTLDIFGIDIAENMLVLARENCPEASFAIMDCREINKLDKNYDAVMIGFCFPYLSKEEAVDVIENAAALLNPRGVIYLSTMEDAYETSGWRTSSKGDKVYMYNHEEGYLQEAMIDGGLNVIEVQRKVYDGWDGNKVTDLIMIAARA